MEQKAKSQQGVLRQNTHPRYNMMRAFCKQHNKPHDYLVYTDKWTAEEFCNILITLCHITDKMLCSYLARLEKLFMEQGGIKERMYAARTGYRKAQDALLKSLQTENEQLKAENERLKAEIKRMGKERGELIDFLFFL